MKNLLMMSATALVALLSVQFVSAATMTMTPIYEQAYDGSFTPLGTPAQVPVGDYVQMDVKMSVSNLLAGENWWVSLFNVAATSGLTPVDLGSGLWMTPATALANGVGGPDYSFPSASPAVQSYAQYDSNGASLGGVQNHWQNGNADVGTNPNDLQVMDVEASAAEANNRRYGEATRPGTGYADQLGSPTLLGTVLFQVTSAGQQSIALTPITGATWGTYENNASGTGNTFAQVAGATFGSVIINPVPEPASLVLCGLGGLGLLAFGRRRRS